MVGTAFRQPTLFDSFVPCANNDKNCLGVLDGSFITQENADPYTVSLLETMVQPKSLQHRDPINCIPTPVNNVDACQH